MNRSISDASKLPEEERARYIQDWHRPGALTAMLNWYRAAKIEVPRPGEKAELPLWMNVPLPKLRTPTLVIWGLKDPALLPVQLEGLAGYVADVRIVTDPEASHFIPWEKPEVVTSAIRDYLAETQD